MRWPAVRGVAGSRSGACRAGASGGSIWGKRKAGGR